RDNVISRNLIALEFEKGQHEFNAFQSQFFDFLNSQENLKKALAPMKKSSADSTAIFFVNDSVESLVRLLLGIDKIQQDLIEKLLELAIEYSDADQLRWLGYVVDPSHLSEKILQISPENLQKDILGALPDIVCDSELDSISQKLLDFIDDSPNLLLPVLDTLSCIKIIDTLEASIQKKVINILPSTSHSDLPAVIMYLFKSIISIPDTSYKVISLIRREISPLLVSDSQENFEFSPKDQKNTTILLFETIRKGLNDNEKEDPFPEQALDLFVFFVLFGIKGSRKKAESTFYFVCKLCNNKDSLMQLYSSENIHPASFSISLFIVSNQDPNYTSISIISSLLKRAFICCGDFEKQEVINLIIGLIGSGIPKSTQIGSKLLLNLSLNHPQKLKIYLPFIKSLLDFVVFLQVTDVRRIFDTLAILATVLENSSLIDELHIYIRKQLTSTQTIYNTTGIVGAVSILKALGSKHTLNVSDPSGPSGSGSSRDSTKNLTDFIAIIQMVMDSGKHRSWEILSMTYDELATLVETTSLHPQLQSWLSENIANIFAEAFLSNINDVKDTSSEYPLARMVTLYQEKDSELVLDIIGLLYGLKNSESTESDSLNPQSSIHLLTDNVDSLMGSPACCLFSLFRLMQVCEKAENLGSLSEIDAVLACGLVMPSVSETNLAEISFVQHLGAEYFEKVNDLAASSVEFREGLNAFCGQSGTEIAERCLTRLNQLATIEYHMNDISHGIDLDLKNLGLTTPTGCYFSESSDIKVSNSGFNNRQEKSVLNVFEENSFTNAGSYSKNKKRNSGGIAQASTQWLGYRRILSKDIFSFIWKFKLQMNSTSDSDDTLENTISFSGLNLLLSELILYLYSPRISTDYSNSKMASGWLKEILSGLSSHLFALLKSRKALDKVEGFKSNKQKTLGLILQLLNALLGNPNHEGQTFIYYNPELVSKQVLAESGSVSKNQVESLNNTAVAEKTFRLLYSFSESFSESSTAVDFVKILKKLIEIITYNVDKDVSALRSQRIFSVKKVLGSVCKDFLKSKKFNFQ
ncbi:hypothetical protein BB560_004713, partial [Smittium megazygosporum]